MRAVPSAAFWVLVLVPAFLPAAETPQQVLEALAARLEADPADAFSALAPYNRIESSGQFDVFGRHQIHLGLLAALRRIKDPGLKRAAAAALKDGSSGAFPAQVLLLKALIGPDFPAPRSERIDWLEEAARVRGNRLKVWAVRLLADSRWPEAVDRLIEVLRREEPARPPTFLGSIASAELYRLLGSPGLGSAAEVEEGWKAMGKKLPREPDRGSRPAKGVTTAFFGDRVSPFSVFLIDLSTSMLQPATLREGAPGRTQAGDRKEDLPKRPKVEIVKKELARALAGLQTHMRFNVLGYNAVPRPWRRGGQRLHVAGSEAVKSAADFVEKLSVAEGTNIHDVLAAALPIPEVETIYLLSDGSPSRGGGPPEIERRVAAMNYLTGIRVVTYGFAPEGTGAFDEAFMKRLAAANWGWYRRLN